MTGTPQPLPGLPGLYLKAVTQIKKGNARRSLPVPVKGALYRCPVDARRLAAFTTHVGARQRHFMLSYLYVMTDRSRFALLTSRTCPYPAVGLIQTSLSVEIDPDKMPDPRGTVFIRSELSAGPLLDNGNRRIALTTSIRDEAGQLIGHVHAGYRVRGPRPKTASGAAKPRKSAEATPPEMVTDRRKIHALPANRGRKYAKVSGDWNPVHLARWLARPFGFKQQIAHGLDLVASAEAMHDHTRLRALSAEFARPVFLPGNVAIAFNHDVKGATFVITEETGETVHASGALTYG